MEVKKIFTEIAFKIFLPHVSQEIDFGSKFFLENNNMASKMK